MTRRTSSETPPAHDPLHVQQQQQQELHQQGEHAHSHQHHRNHQHNNDTAPLHSAAQSHHHDSAEAAAATTAEAADPADKNGVNAEEESLKAIVKDLEEFEFSVGVSEDRNKRCRRSMEVRVHIPSPSFLSPSLLQERRSFFWCVYKGNGCKSKLTYLLPLSFVFAF